MPDTKLADRGRDYGKYLTLIFREFVQGLARATWWPVVTRGSAILLWPPQEPGDALLQETLDQFRFYFSGTEIGLYFYTLEGSNCHRWKMLAGEAPRRDDAARQVDSFWFQLFHYRAIVLRTDRTWRGLTAVAPQVTVLGHWGDVAWPTLLREIIPARIRWPHRAADSLRECRSSWRQARVAVVGAGPSAERFLVDRERMSFEHVVVGNLVALRPEYTVRAEGSSVWICAYDPQLFDDSPLAADFRSALLKAASPKTHLVTTAYLERHIELHFPTAVVERAITVSSAIAPRLRGKWKMDLAGCGDVTETGNVATTLMLPLAASLGRTIVIYGMDGFVRKRDGVETPHNAVFETDHLEDAKNAPILCRRSTSSLSFREMDLFEWATKHLVQQMLARGHSVLLSGPSLNPGLEELPILDDPNVDGQAVP